MREFKRMQIPALAREPNTTCSEIVAEAAFALASGIIDTIPFVGSKLDEQQTRAWPRSGVFTDDGVEMTGTPLKYLSFASCWQPTSRKARHSTYSRFSTRLRASTG